VKPYGRYVSGAIEDRYDYKEHELHGKYGGRFGKLSYAELAACCNVNNRRNFPERLAHLFLSSGD
jgi:hypothetical protein